MFLSQKLLQTTFHHFQLFLLTELQVLRVSKNNFYSYTQTWEIPVALDVLSVVFLSALIQLALRLPSFLQGPLSSCSTIAYLPEFVHWLSRCVIVIEFSLSVVICFVDRTCCSFTLVVVLIIVLKSSIIFWYFLLSKMYKNSPLFSMSAKTQYIKKVIACLGFGGHWIHSSTWKTILMYRFCTKPKLGRH